MKARLILLVLLLAPLAIPARADGWSPLLEAIAAVETPHGVRLGAAGELTRYQILPSTWRRFSAQRMASAGPAEVERVARCILREIDQQLAAQACERTPFQYALRWNAGARARYFKPDTWLYARRVAAVHESNLQTKHP